MVLRRVGGAYGCKISRGHHIAIAGSLVTHLLNRPCRFVLSIEANMRVVGKRPPCSSDFEVIKKHLFLYSKKNKGKFYYIFCLRLVLVILVKSSIFNIT